VKRLGLVVLFFSPVLFHQSSPSISQLCTISAGLTESTRRCPLVLAIAADIPCPVAPGLKLSLDNAVPPSYPPPRRPFPGTLTSPFFFSTGASRSYLVIRTLSLSSRSAPLGRRSFRELKACLEAEEGLPRFTRLVLCPRPFSRCYAQYFAFSFSSLNVSPVFECMRFVHIC